MSEFSEHSDAISIDHPFSRALQWVGRPLLKRAVDVQARILNSRNPNLGDESELIASINASMTPQERMETEFAYGTLAVAASVVVGTAVGVHFF